MSYSPFCGFEIEFWVFFQSSEERRATISALVTAVEFSQYTGGAAMEFVFKTEEVKSGYKSERIRVSASRITTRSRRRFLGHVGGSGRPEGWSRPRARSFTKLKA